MTICQGCTDAGGNLQYWCKWEQNGEIVSQKVVPAREAHVNFPEIVVSFLETKFDLQQSLIPAGAKFLGKTKNIYNVKYCQF